MFVPELPVLYKGLKHKKGYCGIRKQLLDQLKSNYFGNPGGFRRWFRALESQGVRVPKCTQEVSRGAEQAKLF
jgi:hypothetical protein